MKISAISGENFLGFREIDVKISRPIALFSGENGAGKSTLRDMISMALSGDASRVSLQKELGRLINDQATGKSRRGNAAIWVGGHPDPFAQVGLPAGKQLITPTADFDLTPPMLSALPYVLDPKRFAADKAGDRRALLMSVMSVSAGAAAVQDRMLKRGADPLRVQSVAPMLRSGFDVAAKDAARRASEARGAWKATTGETYGEVKAASWIAQAPDFDADKIAAIRTALATQFDAVDRLTKAVSDANAIARSNADRDAQISKLRSTAGAEESASQPMAKLEAELTEIDKQISLAKQQAGQEPPPEPKTYACPDCLAVLVLDSDGTLRHYRPPAQIQFDAGAAQRVSHLEQQRASKAKDLQLCSDTVWAAKNARAAIAALESTPARTPEPGDHAANLASAREAYAALQAQLDTLQKSADAAAAATRLTSAAAAHHADVIGWSEIAAMLSPDGIPAEILADAITPLRDRLDATAAIAEWPPVVIADDMAISVSGRPYELLSEGQQFRVNVLISEALSHLSGLKFILLDRADVLDIPGRGDLFALLESLAEAGEIDTAIVCLTLKQAPASINDLTQSFWVADGQVTEVISARRAA